MTPLTAEEIAELRRLEEGSTPSPWNLDVAGCLLFVWEPHPGGRTQRHVLTASALEDAAFVAAARDAVPRLLAEVERSRSVLARRCPSCNALLFDPLDEYAPCAACVPLRSLLAAGKGRTE